jgi:hypothetical protein
MNSPFIAEQARALAARSDIGGKLAPQDRVEGLYRAVLGRLPDETETELACRFLDEASVRGDVSNLQPLPQLAQVLLSSNEFLFVD